MKERSHYEDAIGTVFLAAIALVALGLRLCPLILRSGIGWAVQVDSLRYIQLANGLRAGCGLAQYAGSIPASHSLERSVTRRSDSAPHSPVEYGFQTVWSERGCGPAELLRTPGYPLFLAAVPNLRAVLVLQGIIGAATSFLVGLFSWRKWGLVAGLLTETIVGFDVGSILFSNWLLTETLFTFCVTLGLLLQLLVISRKTTDPEGIAGLLGAGLLLGAAAFVRPIGQILVIAAPLPVLLLRDSTPARKVLLFILVLFIPIGMINCWSYRNFRYSGVWTFSSATADDMYYHRAGSVLAYESGRPFEQVEYDLLRSTKGGWDANPVELEKRSPAIIAAHPFVLISVVLKGFLKDCLLPSRSFLGDFLGHDVTLAEAGPDLRHKVFSTLSFPPLAVLYTLEFSMTLFTWIGVVLALLRARRAKLRSSALVFIPLLASLLLIGSAAGPETGDRFRVPVVPMLAIVAGFGWATAARPKNARGTSLRKQLVQREATPEFPFSASRESICRYTATDCDAVN